MHSFNTQPMSIAAFSGANKGPTPLTPVSTGIPLPSNKGIFSLLDSDVSEENNTIKAKSGLHLHRQQIDIPQSLQVMNQKGGIANVFESLLNIYAQSYQTPLSGFFYNELSTKKEPSQPTNTTGLGGFGSSFGGFNKSGFGTTAPQSQQTPALDPNVPPYKDELLWMEAKKRIPDYKRYTPVLIYGFEQLAARASTHTTMLEEIKKDIESVIQEVNKIAENSTKINELTNKSKRLLYSMESRLEEQTDVPVPYELACKTLNQSLESQYGDTLRSRFLLLKESIEKNEADAGKDFMGRFPALGDPAIIKQIREHLSTQGNVLMDIAAKIQRAISSRTN